MAHSETSLSGQHRRIALVVTGLALLLAGPANTLPLGMQAAIFGVGLALTGVPHGAVDHRRAAPLLRDRLGASWFSAFAIGYIALAVAIVGLWLLAPTASLIGFLLVSVHHFGSGDSDDRVGIAAHGSVPILTPMIAFPDEVGAVFAALTPHAGAWWASQLRALQLPLVLVLGAMLFALAITRLRKNRDGSGAQSTRSVSSRQRGAVLEVLATACAGLLLPPLLSFSIYFCIWHAPRHILHVAQEMCPGPWLRALRHFALAGLPMTLATLIGGATIALLALTQLDTLRPWLQLAFVGLAALTVPHLIVTEAVGRLRPPDAARHSNTGVDTPQRPQRSTA